MRVIVACRLSRLRDGSTGLDSQERETPGWEERDSGMSVASTWPGPRLLSSGRSSPPRTFAPGMKDAAST